MSIVRRNGRVDTLHSEPRDVIRNDDFADRFVGAMTNKAETKQAKLHDVARQKAREELAKVNIREKQAKQAQRNMW